jgi:hypothetical protein
MSRIAALCADRALNAAEIMPLHGVVLRKKIRG